MPPKPTELFKSTYDDDFARAIKRRDAQVNQLHGLDFEVESPVDKIVLGKMRYLQIQRLKDQVAVVERAIADPSESNIDQALIVLHRDLAPRPAHLN